MSLLMDTQTNRFWARVDFLATGEIVLHIPEECELPIRVLVSRGGRSTEYEPNSSEIPNICEVKNYCDDCLYTDTCDSKEFFYACTLKATISKMEQVDKDINVRSKDEPTTQTETQNSNLTFEKRTMRDCYNCKRYETEDECIECHYEPKDKPQDECAKEYEELGLKKLKELRKDEPQTNADQHVQHVGSVEQTEREGE